MDIESSEEDFDALNERKNHLQLAETMKDVKMVKDLLQKQKTKSFKSDTSFSSNIPLKESSFEEEQP